METYPGKKEVLPGSSLMQRMITGTLLVIAVIGFLASGPLGFLLLLLIIHTIGIREYQRLIAMAGTSPQKITGLVAGTLLLLLSWLVAGGFTSSYILFLFIPLSLLPFIFELFRGHANPFTDSAVTLQGFIWISIPLTLFLFTGFMPLHEAVYHPSILLGYFIILWAGDSGAYFIGKYLGRHPFFPRISPKKTWEGCWGGIAACLVAGLINSKVFPRLTVYDWLILAGIIGLTGIFGDLVKSMLKRSVNVKDAGRILPGHGGILDRFDSLMGSAPFVFIYLFFYA